MFITLHRAAKINSMFENTTFIRLCMLIIAYNVYGRCW